MRRVPVAGDLDALYLDLLICQVIYVARNPKDVIVSYYFLYKLYKVVHDYQGDLELFAEYFMNDEGNSPVDIFLPSTC